MQGLSEHTTVTLSNALKSYREAYDEVGRTYASVDGPRFRFFFYAVFLAGSVFLAVTEGQPAWWTVTGVLLVTTGDALAKWITNSHAYRKAVRKQEVKALDLYSKASLALETYGNYPQN